MIRLLALILSISFIFPVYSGEKQKSATISPRLYKKLTNIESLIAKKSYQQAEQKLTSILTKVNKNSYEHAAVLRSLSSVHALRGQYKKAAKKLSQAINLNVLPKEQMQQSILNLGQLYMATESYAKAIKTLEPWLANNSSKKNVQLNVLVANAYAQLKQYRKALPYIKKAIIATKNPDESWYQLNLAILYELERYPAAATLLKKMIRLHPDKKTYWDQLSSIYQQTKQYKKAVSIKHLAYKKGFNSNEKAILELANLFLYVGSPYKAAELLRKEIRQKNIKSTSKNWEALAHAWTIGKEFDKAIEALKIASKLNAKGSLYQQLGQIYIEQEKWNLAIDALKNAINKGHLKKIGTTYLLLGMSYYEQNNTKQARKFFLKASKYHKNKKAAKQWLEYIK